MQRKWEMGIGVVGLLFAIIALAFWFPHDIKGKFMEVTMAGVKEPGDAFFPIILTSIIAFFSVVQLIIGALQTSYGQKSFGYISTRNIGYLAILFLIISIGLALMYWMGPLFVAMLGVAKSYRLLVDTIPYKYIGFLTGGFLITFSIITWAEGRVRKRSAVVSVLLLLILISIFDLALNNIQLPPNADF